jgi:hypothetical protein
MSTKDALIVLMAVGVVSFLAGMFFIHYILGCIMGLVQMTIERTEQDKVMMDRFLERMKKKREKEEEQEKLEAEKLQQDYLKRTGRTTYEA